MGLPLNYLRIIAASSKYLFRIFRLFNRRKNIVPLHYDNMHIHVIDKHFLRLRKSDIFQRKIVIFLFFS